MSTCPTCGTPVRVVSSDEGTSYYEPLRSGEEETAPDLRDALESVVRLIEVIPYSVDVEQAGMQAEVAIATARETLSASPPRRALAKTPGEPE